MILLNLISPIDLTLSVFDVIWREMFWHNNVTYTNIFSGWPVWTTSFSYATRTNCKMKEWKLAIFSQCSILNCQFILLCRSGKKNMSSLSSTWTTCGICHNYIYCYSASEFNTFCSKNVAILQERNLKISFQMKKF